MIFPQTIFCSAWRHSDEASLIVQALDMQIVEINTKACHLLGMTRESLISMPVSSIECSLQDIFFWDELSQDFEKYIKQPREIESEWLSANGQPIPIKKKVSAIEESGNKYWVIFVTDIRERHKIAKEQLILSSQLQSTLEATNEGIMSVDLNLKCLNINRRFITMLNLADELVVSGEAGAILESLGQKLLNQQPLREVLEKIQSEPETEAEVTLALNNDRYWVFSTKPEYLRDRLIGRLFSLRDITPIKKVEQDLVRALKVAEDAVHEKTYMLDALKVSESRLRRLINSSLIGICQGDMKGQLTLINDALIQLIGSDRQQVINNRIEWLKFTPLEYQQAHNRAIDELKETGQTQPFYSELMHQNGHKIPVLVGLAQLEGSEFEWVGFVLDLTEKTKADKMKAEFISVVSHELRTPITSIRGALGLLESGTLGELTPAAKNLVEIAHRNSRRLLTLVNDILDMEKLLSGKMTFNIQTFDLVDLAKQAIQINANYAETYNVSYELNLQTSLTDAKADPERIMQVFANLLSNAAKFSPPGSKVLINIKADNKKFYVEVVDKGPGIPDEFRNRIFTKFAQADGSSTRQQGGTGLGLSISKNIIEKLSGEIGFDSEVGVGSNFWFSLPRA